ncbi:MAG: DUF4831 family protein [Bacteroidales bacterium]|nr:DUF4831 family protein [Bacteroidales bacterium]
MKERLIAFLYSVIILMTGCIPSKTASKSDMVILPLGGEVKVTDGSIVYALPLTVLEFDIVAERTIEIPGPYSEFAEEMIGLADVIADENEYWSLRSVTLRTVEELDPSQYYVIEGTTLMQTNLLALRKSGLVLDINPERYASSVVSHNQGESDFQGPLFPDLGAQEYTSMKTDTAYKVVKADTAFIRIPYLVQKKKSLTLEEEAGEAARRLLELREGKHMILTGETNIFPQDGSAIDEINRLDREYSALFAGKSWTETKHYRIWFTPQLSMAGDKTTLFTFSETGGLTDAGTNSSDPVSIELIPSGKTRDLNLIVRPVVSEKEIAVADKLFYRVPDVVDIRVSAGNKTICTARKLIYQFGNTVALPSNFVIGK